MNNYYQPIMPQQQPRYMPSGLRGHFVSSIEEARAAAAEFDGSVSYFPDVVNKKIYTKQINMDGTSSFQVYELSAQPIEAETTYVTQSQLATILADFKASLLTPAESQASQKTQEFKF